MALRADERDRLPEEKHNHALFHRQGVDGGGIRGLAKVTHNLLRKYMGYAYEYDSQDNTVVKLPRMSTVANEEGTLTFAYDAENRMTTAVRTFATSRVVARYSYDAFGRRIAKRVDEQRWAEAETPPRWSRHTGVLTLFVWDGDVMVQEVHANKTVTNVIPITNEIRNFVMSKPGPRATIFSIISVIT